VQRVGQVLRCQLNQPVRAGWRGEVGRRRGAAGQPVTDPGPGQFAVADGIRRPLRDDPAAADHRDVIGQELRLVHVVGGQQHRLAQRRQVPNLTADA
jgi:hypothetical protein